MDAMKGSGIEWIGEIPEHWKICRLKQIATINSGEYIPKSEYSECGKYTIVGSNGAIGKTNYFNNEKRVLTTGRVGTIGTVGIAEKCWITDNALIIDTNFNLDYLRYVIQNFDFASLCSGTAQPLITASSLGEQYIPFPDEVTQVKIAGYLDCKCSEIDTLIAAKEKTNALLKERRQSIIYEAVTKGLNPDVPMKDSGVEWIGEIPEEWKTIKVKHTGHYQSGDSITAAEITQEGEYPVYGGNGLRGYTTRATHHGEYLLIGRQGALCGNVHFVKGDFWASEHAVVGDISEKFDAKYVYYVLDVFGLNRLSLTAAQPGISVEQIVNVVIPCPSSLKLQKQISDYLDTQCDNLDMLVSANKKEIELLKEYRQSVIFEAVTGKMEV